MNNIVAAAVLVGSFFACKTMSTKPSSIKEVLGFELPEYVTTSQFHSESGMGLIAYLKCTIPSEKLDAFLQHSPMFPDSVTIVEEPIRFASYNTKSSWWSPSELKAPVYGSKIGQRDKWRTSSYLAADEDGKGRILIYFLYIEER